MRDGVESKCSVESLPEEILSEEEYAPAGCRYDHQIAVFGRTLQARLGALRAFLVGAGALGCEFLKNFALMGVACGDAPTAPGGAAAPAGGAPSVTVTDDDVIEKSNLSRQFLFRDWDIGGFKAAVAGAAAQRINPALRAQLLQNRVSVDTEDVFDDEFWEGLDVVVNALDNVNARLYVDSRCVYFQRPLLESGTLGTKCNTQVCTPDPGVAFAIGGCRAVVHCSAVHRLCLPAVATVCPGSCCSRLGRRPMYFRDRMLPVTGDELHTRASHAWFSLTKQVHRVVLLLVFWEAVSASMALL